MHSGKYVLAQLLDFLDQYQFSQCVKRYRGDKRMRKLTCSEQFLALIFGQLSGRESLRDTVNCLSAHPDKLYHLGFREKVARNTLAVANEKRDWRIYRDFAYTLIHEARRLFVREPEMEMALQETVYLLDATIIELCIGTFGWAHYRETDSGVKLHMQLDLRGSIPTFFDITTAQVYDINFLDKLHFERGAYYVIDRGYFDYERWYKIHRAGAYFVTRARRNSCFKRLYSNPVDKASGVRCDQTVTLSAKRSFLRYPDKLRRIKYWDEESGATYIFLTNDFNSDALTITVLYKHRWEIEVFFKWIKQHLKIKSFWGTSPNAVKTQICIALCAYLLVAIARKKLKIKRNPYEILQILSVSLLDKKPLRKLFTETKIQKPEHDDPKQARLEGF